MKELMLRRVIFALITAAAMPAAVAQPAAPAAPAPAKAGPGTTSVKLANDTIANLLKQKAAPGSAQEKALAAKVTSSVRGFLDIDELGKRAMVDNWSKLTPAQQTQFLTVLRELIEANYVAGLRANLNYTVDYTGESTDAQGNTVVTTKINTVRKGRPFQIEVDYVLVKQGDKLRAFDVVTDKVGLVDNYRTMFNKIIAKGGFDDLIKKMKDKQTQLAQKTSTAP